MIYMGYEGQSSLDDPLLYNGDRPIATIGPNGSGKSRRALLVALERLRKTHACVVFDPKGDLAKMLAEPGDIIINPFNVLDMGSSGFDPVMTLPINDDLPDDAMGLAEALIRVEGKEPFFAQAMQEFAAGIIMWARLHDLGLPAVRAVLGESDAGIRSFVGSDSFMLNKKKYLGAIQTGIRDDFEEIGIKTSRFLDLAPENKELHSVLTTGLAQTRWLDSRSIKKDLMGSAFDFATLKEKRRFVFIVLPPRRRETHSSWVRMMLTAGLQMLLRDTKKAAVPVFLIIDEAASLGRLEILENLMAVMRGYFVRVWTLWQDLPQMQAVYQDRWESFLSNAGATQVFRTNDVTTSEYFSKLSGQRTVIALSGNTGKSRTATQMPTRTEGMSASAIPLPTLTPDDFRSLEEGWTYNFSHQVNGPFKTYLPYPTELKHMRSIVAKDPSS